MRDQRQILAEISFNTIADKHGLPQPGMADPMHVEGDDPPFRHWVAADYDDGEDDLSPARGFFNGLAIAGAFWAIVAAFTLAWFVS